jgi:hypothetical protein
LVLIAITVAYATVIGNALEFGENNRFRFETDPLVCVAIVALSSYAVTRRARAVRSPTSGAGVSDAEAVHAQSPSGTV